MSEHYPVIQVRTEEGHLKVRDGLILCFFVRSTHARIAQAVWHSLQTYLRLIPPNSLEWYRSTDGDRLPLDAEGWMHIREKILNRPHDLACHVGISQLEYEAGGYKFEYDGCRIGLWPNDSGREVCSMCFSLPTDYLLNNGPDKVRLGEWPSAMDTREPLQVPHFRALARLLEPYFPEEKIGLTSLLDDRNMGRWLRRFCL